MLFYKVEGKLNGEVTEEVEVNRRRVDREKARKISLKSDSFNQKNRKKAFFFVSSFDETWVMAGALCFEKEISDRMINSYFETVGLDVSNIRVDEVTFNTIHNMLSTADRNEFINETDEVLETYDLESLACRYGRSVRYDEYLIDESCEHAIFLEADRLFSKDTLLPELYRIYQGKGDSKASGHPVHYLIETDDVDTENAMRDCLVQALYANDRIQSRRVCTVDFRPGEDFSRKMYESFYKTCIGGTVAVRYFADDDQEDDRASCQRETIEKICEAMKKYRNKVLTVFCLPRECTTARDILFEYLCGVSLVEMKEEFAFGEKAESFLKTLAKENSIRPDKKLLSQINPEKGYLAPDLHTIFNEWFSHKLKEGVYPQYKAIDSIEHVVATALPKGSAYDELMEMVGLSSAKKVIKQALNYYKAQKIFAEKGMKEEHPAMHMVFTGNPGTAKTSVARLFADIMKDNGLLSKGELIEVGRGDLVGKYVGWTAPTITRKFKQAKGSVLFIDEAYSLVDDRDGSYGDEAINTIVQEMENHRDDVVVIFAGYPDKMEEFLDKNPGLRSRIAFHVKFDDYNADELCEISALLAKKKGMTISDEAMDRIHDIMARAVLQKDFGNGRFARNLIERAKMAQACRLIEQDLDKVSSRDVATLCDEDIVASDYMPKTKRGIGFVS